MIWDFRIQTDRHFPHNTPGLITVDKKDKKVHWWSYLVPMEVSGFDFADCIKEAHQVVTGWMFFHTLLYSHSPFTGNKISLQT